MSYKMLGNGHWTVFSDTLLELKKRFGFKFTVILILKWGYIKKKASDQHSKHNNRPSQVKVTAVLSDYL